jgi:hypothetical protein
LSFSGSNQSFQRLKLKFEPLKLDLQPQKIKFSNSLNFDFQRLKKWFPSSHENSEGGFWGQAKKLPRIRTIFSFLPLANTPFFY